MERDAQLDDFYRKQDEIEKLLQQTRETAREEKKKLMAETKEECLKVLAQTEEEKKKILDKAKVEAQELHYKAMVENRKLQEDTIYLRSELDQLAEKLKPILFPKGAGQSGDKGRRTDTAAGTQAEGLISK